MANKNWYRIEQTCDECGHNMKMWRPKKRPKGTYGSIFCGECQIYSKSSGSNCKELINSQTHSGE